MTVVVVTEENQREDCPDCLRPVTVCWCPYLARPRVTVRTRLVVFQHPGETKRNIRTCRMLELGLAPHCVSVIPARRFPGSHQELAGILSAPGTRLLYPGPESEVLDEVEAASVETLVILDGTWDQARKIYSRNPAVQALRKVSLAVSTPSQYIVRTQPNSACMSTLEVSSHQFRFYQIRKHPDISGWSSQPRNTGEEAGDHRAPAGSSGGHVQLPDQPRGGQSRQQGDQTTTNFI